MNIADYDWLSLIAGRAILGLALIFLTYLVAKNLFLLSGYVYGAFRARRYGSIDASVSWFGVLATGWAHFADRSYHGMWFEKAGKCIPLFGFSRVRKSTMFPAPDDAALAGDLL